METKGTPITWERLGLILLYLIVISDLVYVGYVWGRIDSKTTIDVTPNICSISIDSDSKGLNFRSNYGYYRFTSSSTINMQVLNGGDFIPSNI